jgi:hypothetical protein
LIESQIQKLGNSFRGLWTGITVQDSFGGITKKKDWTVTFVLDGDYVETPGFDTPEESLDYAIKMISKNGGNKCQY